MTFTASGACVDTIDACGGASDYATQDVVVSGAGGCTGVYAVAIDMTHTWVGDLTVTLTNPSNTVMPLFMRPALAPSTMCGGCCGNSSDLGGTYVFQNGIGSPVPDGTGSPPVSPGVYSPTDDFGAAIDGLTTSGTPDGTWTVSVWDGAGGDNGSFGNTTIVLDCPP